MSENKQKIKRISIRMPIDLYGEVLDLVDSQKKLGIRATQDMWIQDAIRQKLHNLKDIQSLQIDSSRDKMLGVPGVLPVPIQIDAALAGSIPVSASPADRPQALGPILTEGEGLEQAPIHTDSGPEGLGGRKKRVGGDAD